MRYDMLITMLSDKSHWNSEMGVVHRNTLSMVSFTSRGWVFPVS